MEAGGILLLTACMYAYASNVEIHWDLVNSPH